MPNQCIDMKVEELIDSHMKGWNITKVTKLFPPPLAVAIMKLFLPTTPVQLYWEQEKRGVYTVCSAYRMCKQAEK